MNGGTWHPKSGVNPPYNVPIPTPDHMGKGELLEYHSKAGHMAAFYDLYPDSKPACAGQAGCPCPACCKMRGRITERER